MYPFHGEVQKYFPDFDYRKPVPGTIVDMRDPKNVTGHQQRAFTTYWALQTCGPLQLGIDMGSPKGLTPYCVHVDVFGNGRPHPFYPGGAYYADLALDAADSRELACLPMGAWPYIASNHSLEHMPARAESGAIGDAGIVQCLRRWLQLLRPGGLLAMIIPDNAHFDVMKSDPDHKHAWSHTDFVPRVLDPLGNSCVKNGMPMEVVEYDTLDNHFSFNVLLRRR